MGTCCSRVLDDIDSNSNVEQYVEPTAKYRVGTSTIHHGVGKHRVIPHMTNKKNEIERDMSKPGQICGLHTSNNFGVRNGKEIESTEHDQEDALKSPTNSVILSIDSQSTEEEEYDRCSD